MYLGFPRGQLSMAMIELQLGPGYVHHCFGDFRNESPFITHRLALEEGDRLSDPEVELKRRAIKAPHPPRLLGPHSFGRGSKGHTPTIK